MTAFNRERYIAAAIESVLAQRFTDFELVITDNCSTDGTVAVAQRYADADPRIRLTVNERNLGQFGNRNRAASLARGRYLKYHDSDDLLYPHCLQVMVEAMGAQPSPALGLSSGRAWPGGPCPMVLTPTLSYEREFLGHGVFQCGPGGSIIEKTAFDAAGGFTEVGVHADYLLWMAIAKRHPIVLLPADLFWYRPHAAQEFNKPEAAQEYARLGGDVWRALAEVECPLAPAAVEQARRNQAWNIVKLIWRDVRAGNLNLAGYRARQSGLSIADWFHYLRRRVRRADAGTPRAPDGDVVLPQWTRFTGFRP